VGIAAATDRAVAAAGIAAVEHQTAGAATGKRQPPTPATRQHPEAAAEAMVADAAAVDAVVAVVATVAAVPSRSAETAEAAAAADARHARAAAAATGADVVVKYKCINIVK